MDKNELYKLRLNVLHERIKKTNQQLKQNVDLLKAEMQEHLAFLEQEKAQESKVKELA